MRKGISTWLFTKVVMLIFLTMTFAIILSFTSVVQQRAVAEAGQQITINIKDSTLSMLGIQSLKSSRHVMLPEEIPQTSEKSEKYTVHLTKSTGSSGTNISAAVALGKHTSLPIESYLTASSFHFPPGYIVNFCGNGNCGKSELLLNSEDYNFIIINLKRSTTGSGNILNISGCGEDTVGEC